MCNFSGLEFFLGWVVWFVICWLSKAGCLGKLDLGLTLRLWLLLRCGVYFVVWG